MQDRIRFYHKGRYIHSLDRTTFQQQGAALADWIRRGGDLKYRDLIINDPDSIGRIYEL